MPKTAAFEDDILEHIFNNTSLANIGDASGLGASSTAGSFYIALYTTSPTKTGSGVETTYTGYSRVAVARSSAEWDILNGEVENVNPITFGENTGSSVTITAYAIFTASTGGDRLYFADLQTSVTIGANQTFRFPAGGIAINEY